jgi:hypothetical protein
MEDPVVTIDGHTYERRAIEKWFTSGKDTSPVTGAKLMQDRQINKTLTSNHTLRKAIQEWTKSCLLKPACICVYRICNLHTCMHD